MSASRPGLIYCCLRSQRGLCVFAKLIVLSKDEEKRGEEEGEKEKENSAETSAANEPTS